MKCEKDCTCNRHYRSPETRRMLSENAKRQWAEGRGVATFGGKRFDRTGTTHTPETRRKMSKSASARWDSDEERERMSAAYKLFWNTPTGSCPICGREAALVRDHDHITGKERGYICGRCNTAIGFLGDNIEGVLRALAYLEQTT